MRRPQRIVCLTEEPTEILCALGLESLIVGISAFTVRPPGIETRKPVVSAYLDGSVKKIKALEPDLVIGFSDIQAKLAAKLIKAHLPVVIFNQRSIEDILDVILTTARLVGEEAAGYRLIGEYQNNLAKAQKAAQSLNHRPTVYFEEWDEPMISAIQWVSELIDVAGGIPLFADAAQAKGAHDRVVTEKMVIDADPDIVIASWCGKPVDFDAFKSRPGFDGLSAVKNNQLFEMDPCIILQPGPAALTDGLDTLKSFIHGTD